MRTNVTASTTRSRANRSRARSSRGSVPVRWRAVSARPWVQLDASHTTGSSPSRVATHSASTTLRAMVAAPSGRPLDDHGVPQHSPPIPSGTTSPTPARSHSARNAASAPTGRLPPSPPHAPPGRSASAGAKSSPMHDANSTARAEVAPPSGTTAVVPRRGPGPGRSASTRGTTSVPTTPRATSDATRTSGVGRAWTTPSAARRPVTTGPQCSAAAAPPRCTRRGCDRARWPFMTTPVSMPTGHASTHSESAAHVATPW
ncbi:Uncharacterised protein [Mycobacteroides abscessus]|nr:Uncharacterised protein [Mycobacteroides abscessus]